MTIPTAPATNLNINTTFTVAMQWLTTGLNFRNVKANQSVGIPVINNYDVSTISIAASSSQTVYAYQLVGLISDTLLNVIITPDQTASISSPGSSTSQGYVFLIQGSFLTSGVTMYNATSSTATVQVATVS